MSSSPTDILIHTCCSPCLVYPADILKKEGFKITAYWYNPNIHGPREYEKRKMALGYYLNRDKDIDYIADIYNIKDWCAGLDSYNMPERCMGCYKVRLKKTAETALKNNIGIFTTTLLYSKFQKHDIIKDLGQEIADETGIKFYYKDFRKGWKEGINMSKDMELYRQEYCGCIFSAKDRYNVS
ncbi:MAG: epoxyqueuosine reductase QueH [Elusimicrobia bacterium]|jgi:predicted adenine nucleotide alpha hydrolase (AANH) superfamily ATPase|nr:epoxyqueuosine reductase QueH [Elusimicrobiota bacterium]